MVGYPKGIRLFFKSIIYISIMIQKIHAFIPTIKNTKAGGSETDSCKKEDK